ncbi:MAG: outer membrane beta-barrel protein [Holophagales bacterium]|jgi:hypothetical protein|nr:outer membrane beta-barrel protein [Holophagales bacterium]
MKMTRFLAAAFLVSFASSGGLLAQDNDLGFKLNLSGGFNFAQGHAHDMTQTTWGGLGAFTGEFGVEFKHPYAPRVSIRPNVGVAKILSNSTTEQNPNLYDLMRLYFGFDLAYSPIDLLPVTFSIGPSFQVWNVDKVDVETDPNMGNKQIKFGWRFGIDYKISTQWRAGLDYTFAEWRTLRNSGPSAVPGASVITPGFNPSRPAYFCLKATYIF